MTACPTFTARTVRRPEAGFTLVELMVALLLSLLLAVAMLKMQSKMASQTVRVSDVGTRDTQVRAAMDLITRDVSSAGFMMGNMQYTCNALITYNSGSGYFAHHPVDALAAVYGTKMNFAPSLTLTYPPAAPAGLVSDVLVTTGATDSTQMTNPVLNGNAPIGGTPLADGIVPYAASPTGSPGFVLNDTAIVAAYVGGSRACLRVPVSKIGPGLKMESDPGTTMPSNYYTGFVTPVANAGFSGALNNVGVVNSFIVGIGTHATSTQVTTAYYIDGSGAYPVLMRAQYSLIDDAVVTAPQPIAAGVVALRVSFGVDPAATGAVTAYESSAQVTTNHHWDFVRSVRVAMVTRTINDDPNADKAGYSAPTTIPIGPAGGTSSAWFSSITVPTSTHRFVVSTTEIANRNQLWRN